MSSSIFTFFNSPKRSILSDSGKRTIPFWGFGDKASAKKARPAIKRKAEKPAQKSDIALAAKLNERFKRYEKALGNKYRVYAHGGSTGIMIRKYVPAQLRDIDAEKYRPIGNGQSVMDKFLHRYFEISWEDFKNKSLRELDKVFFRKEQKEQAPEPKEAKQEPKAAPPKKEAPKKAGENIVENLKKELVKLQRELNSPRLSTYTEGDTSKEEADRKKERESKLARFDEVLRLLRVHDNESSEEEEPPAPPHAKAEELPDPVVEQNAPEVTAKNFTAMTEEELMQAAEEMF